MGMPTLSSTKTKLTQGTTGGRGSCRAEALTPADRRPFRMMLPLVITVLVAIHPSRTALSSERTPPQAGSSFTRDVVPFLEQYCVHCHAGSDPEAGIGFDRYRESSHIQEQYALWEKAAGVLAERLMPPEDESQPTDAEVQQVTAAIQEELARFDCSQPRPGRVTLRRLNRAEYNNTIRDLVGIDFRPADDFPSDDVGEGFDNIGDVLSIPPLLLEKYLAAAEAVVSQALEDDTGKSYLLSAGDDWDETAVVRQNLALFASRAYRRPATDDELDRLLGLIKYVRGRGGSPQQAYRAALHAILSSPHFVFLVEQGPEKSLDGVQELNDYQLATRLSYFLWSSMPDKALFELAEKGSLRDRRVLEAQVLRMLADEKSAALVENFAGQWLQLRDLRNLHPDREKFPDFDDELRTAMLRETQVFFEAIMREDRSVLEILGADFTFVNGRLARHYGMDGIEGDEFQRVSLSGRRRGVLTHASILLLTSNPTRTSPVKRGKWIMENILGVPPPPPPEGVEELEEDAEVLGSMRERLEQHRTNESCAVCHRRMDPIGFGLENFDAIGAWRDRDGRFEIDASGNLLGGRQFDGPHELMTILIEEKQGEFCRCLARKMLTYALGRGLTNHDRCAIDEITKQLEKRNFRFSALVSAIVNSDPFTLRAPTGVE